MGHGILSGPSWGKIRNLTRLPGVQQISHGDKVVSCRTGPDMDLEKSVQESEGLHTTVLVSLLAGAVLFIVNSLILASICYKRTPHRPRWDRTADRGADSTECLNNECLTSNPETPHLVPNFTSPVRTSSLQRQSVPLSSFPRAVHQCSVTKYRTYGNSYVGIPPPDQPDYSAVPLVAEIPAPGPFNGQQVTANRADTDIEDSITC